MNYNPGTLVRVRNRDWVVLPSDDKDLLLLKPLGGTEAETTGIYLPLRFPEDEVKSSQFPLPTAKDIGNIASARILYNAARLSFRHASGPFRSIAKLSFRPRSFQMVPLIMSLKLEVIRLLIADDVGVGKTIEALLIVKELLERREIKRFAIICLPHLCEQWQSELKDKFGIDAVIIRSNTQARLDRDIHGDTSVYEYYPYQVISIDYIKSDTRKQVFVHECPEMVIVDEAHTCAKPSGATRSQQQRYNLLYELSKKQSRHIILLTATPHSGKPEEFYSLLGLLKPEFENLAILHSTDEQRKELAKYFVQRRRADVTKWMKEVTPFPERDTGEYDYTLSENYLRFYREILLFARALTKDSGGYTGKYRFRYWTALALLRGVMSSPAAGIEMLNNRLEKVHENEEVETDEINPVLDDDYGNENDLAPTQLIEKNTWSTDQNRRLKEFSEKLGKLKNLKDDRKAAWTLEILKDWLDKGKNPVIFCRYIATANYLGNILAPELKKFHKEINLQVITSEDPDEVRKQRIDEMSGSNKSVLVATDCLSEGINLQEHFTAVLHYDLPWNPNRLEQREGRVDRFGQKADVVFAYMLYGKDNPIDGVVLRVLLRKVREIRKDIGISVPFPEDSKSIMDAVLHAVLLNPSAYEEQMQIDFGESDPVRQSEIKATKVYDEAADREKESRSIFAQNSIKAEEIEEDLIQTDEAIGDVKSVEDFVVAAVQEMLKAQITKDKKGYRLYTTNLPSVFHGFLPNEKEIKISFDSPTPDGYHYIGRNHPFVDQLCQFLLAGAVQKTTEEAPSRCAVVRTDLVLTKTSVILFRVRNVIEDKRFANQLVAEEMILWGYEGNPEDGLFIDHQTAKELIMAVTPINGLTTEAKEMFFKNEFNKIKSLYEDKNKESTFNKIAIQRAQVLVEAHERFRKAIGGSKYQVVEPVLPMDVMGIYILLPQTSKS